VEKDDSGSCSSDAVREGISPALPRRLGSRIVRTQPSPCTPWSVVETFELPRSNLEEGHVLPPPVGARRRPDLPMSGRGRKRHVGLPSLTSSPPAFARDQVAKPSGNRDRRVVVDEMRRKQQAADRVAPCLSSGHPRSLRFSSSARQSSRRCVPMRTPISRSRPWRGCFCCWVPRPRDEEC
jgi:hypothetical protein